MRIMLEILLAVVELPHAAAADLRMSKLHVFTEELCEGCCCMLFTIVCRMMPFVAVVYCT